MDISRMTEAEKKDTLKEAKILEALDHPNIIKFHEVYRTRRGKLCIVMVSSIVISLSENDYSPIHNRTVCVVYYTNNPSCNKNIFKIETRF